VDVRTLCTGRKIGHRWQHAVIDIDLFSSVFGLSIGFGNHNSDVVANIAHLALRERRMGTGFHRRAILRMDHPAAYKASDLVCGEIIAGEDRNDARHLLGLGSADLLDRGVGMG
jgi:hypothetical protein